MIEGSTESPTKNMIQKLQNEANDLKMVVIELRTQKD